MNPSTRPMKIKLLRSSPQITWGGNEVKITITASLHLLIYAADQWQEEYEREPFAMLVLGEDSKPQQLRDGLSILKGTLEKNGAESLLYGPKLLTFKRSLVEVDAHTFAERAKRLLSRSDLEVDSNFVRQLQEVLELYEDDFLKGYVFESNGLKAWQESRQAELAALYHDLLDQMIRFHLGQGAFVEAQHYAEKWLNSQEAGFIPLQYLIWLGIWSTRYASVQRYLGLLQHEEDTNPAFFGTTVAEWRALIDAEEPSPVPSLWAYLLPPIPRRMLEPGYIERRAILIDMLERIIGMQPARVIGLTGLPGVGKTQFARQLVQALRESQANFAVGWLELTSNSDFETLLNDLFSQLHLQRLRELPYPEKLKQFKQQLQGVRCLVVVDEGTSRLLSDGEFVQTLTSTMSGVRLLLIARQMPDIEHFPLELAGFNTAYVSEFFVRQAPDLKPMDADELETVTAITGGLPLALSWLVGFLKIGRFPISPFIKALDELRGAVWTFASAPANYRYMLNWLWQQLWSDEKNILYTVSMFDPVDGASAEDVMAIAKETFVLKADQLQQKLEQLVSFGLLQARTQPDSTKRYILHPITYTYVQEQAQQTPEERQKQRFFLVEAIRHAYIHRFFVFAYDHADDFLSLDLYKTNIIHMFQMVLLQGEQQNPKNQIVTTLNRLYDYFDRRGLYRIAEQLLQNALSFDDISDLERVKLLHHLGQAKLKQRELDFAEQWLQNAWALAQELKVTEMYSVILRDLGRVYVQRGKHDVAREHLEEGKIFAKQHQQHVLYGQILANLGVISLDLLGQADSAGEYFDHIRHELSDKEDLKLSYEYRDLFQFVEFTLGRIAVAKQDYLKAEIHFQSSLALARDLNNPERIIMAYLNLGAVKYNQSLFDEAFDYFLQGGIVAEYVQHSEMLVWSIWNKGIINLVKGEYKSARQMLQIALNQANDLGMKSTLPYIFVWFGILHFCQAQFEQARRYFAEVFGQRASNSWAASLALYGLSLTTRYENDVAMQDKLEAAEQQIAQALVGAFVKRADLPVITEGDLRRAHAYFQVALNDRPGLERFLIVEALLRWLGIAP